MLAAKLYILPGLLVSLCLALAGLYGWNWSLRRHPVMFAQATVTQIQGGRISFRLFDGNILELYAAPRQLLRLSVGDYGRLTYRAGRFLRLEQ